MAGVALFSQVLAFVSPFRVPDWLHGADLAGAIVGFSLLFGYVAFVLTAIAAALYLLLAGGTAVMLGLVGADRIPETLVGGFAVLFVGAALTGWLEIELPAVLALPSSFVGGRLVIEATHRQ